MENDCKKKGARNCQANLYASYNSKISQNYDTNHVRIISPLYKGIETMMIYVSFENAALIQHQAFFLPP